MRVSDSQPTDSVAVQLTLEETAIEVFPAVFVGLILLGETVTKLIPAAAQAVATSAAELQPGRLLFMVV
jgi:hypothetical protein